jgi:hypothetical protein
MPLYLALSRAYDCLGHARVEGGVMRAYKFKIGQTVFVRLADSDDAPEGAFIITKRLPECRGQLQYQVRNSAYEYDRVVLEGELRPS